MAHLPKTIGFSSQDYTFHNYFRSRISLGRQTFPFHIFSKTYFEGGEESSFASVTEVAGGITHQIHWSFQMREIFIIFVGIVLHHIHCKLTYYNTKNSLIFFFLLEPPYGPSSRSVDWSVALVSWSVYRLVGLCHNLLSRKAGKLHSFRSTYFFFFVFCLTRNIAR